MKTSIEISDKLARDIEGTARKQGISVEKVIWEGFNAYREERETVDTLNRIYAENKGAMDRLAN
ncbi:MAG: hypothetical protein E6468_07715 [Varibaculum cambriense]|uniref:hypothetical protein n=1 Tax=Varibaculum cambriense TaxID=184870 RepID=UPI0029157434|nr:hypothetical protein [Varibaculum cambriense]MDU6681717.1 hypothetical protein [Varibaculum cambriense]